jgi:hypothetical protein
VIQFIFNWISENIGKTGNRKKKRNKKMTFGPNPPSSGPGCRHPTHRDALCHRWVGPTCRVHLSLASYLVTGDRSFSVAHNPRGVPPYHCCISPRPNSTESVHALMVRHMGPACGIFNRKPQKLNRNHHELRNKLRPPLRDPLWPDSAATL